MLYGRDAELARICTLLDDARHGCSGVLLLHGDAGVGKSALLDAAGALASDMLVLTATGVESEARLPYAGLHQLLRPLLGRLSGIPLPQARALRGALGLDAGTADHWFLVSAAVLSLLAEVAEERPLLCVIDDAHCLDDASAASLGFACRRLAAERIAMVFAAREVELPALSLAGFAELRLDGLPAAAAGQLLDHHAPQALSSAGRVRLIEASGGNPLALIALGGSLTDAQLVGAEPLSGPIPVDARVRQEFLARVGRLPAATQTLLLVAAAEETGSVATIVRAAGRFGVGIGALDAAERDGLIRARGTRLEFRHPLVRSAIYHDAPLSRRRAAHDALAEALDSEWGADRRAWHLAAACLGPDPVVVAALEEAAARARSRSGFVAASLAFERAAQLCTDGPRRSGLLVRAVESAWFGGRVEHAFALLARARRSADDPVQRAEIDQWQGIIELNVGVPADACELLVRSARAMVTADRDRALYALCLAMLAAGYAGDRAATAAIVDLAADIGDDGGPVGRLFTQFVRGAGSCVTGAFDAATASLRSACVLTEDADAAESAAYLGLLLIASDAAQWLGDDDSAYRFARRLNTRARDAGALSLLTQTVPRLAVSQLALGRWPMAAAELLDGAELTRQTGQHQVGAHLVAMQALVAAVRGDEDGCRAFAAHARDLSTARRLVHVEQTAQWALLVLELSLGRTDAALACARQITVQPIALWAGLDRVEAAVRADDPATAWAWLGPYQSWADAAGVPWARAVAAHCQALLSDDPPSLFVAALDQHADAARPFERARTELAYGEFLRRGRRRREAREHLRAALAGFESLGAAAWVERARAELRASGQTARRRAPDARDTLTPQELQIARSVAQGPSNREVAAQLFLSPRTVDFHLRNVFRKLGITSRMQLAQLEFEPSEEHV